MSLSIRLAVIDSDGAPSAPIVVECAPGTTFAALHDALALPYVPHLDGRAVTDDDLLGEPPLVDGALLEPPRQNASDRESVLRLVSASGPRQGAVMPLAAGDLVLGRGHALLGDDPLVSRRHAHVSVARGHVTVRDLGSSNGISAEGSALDPSREHAWQVGESIRLGASVLRLGVASDEGPAGLDETGSSYELPRSQTFTWPDAPEGPRSAPLRWIAVLAPVPVALILAFVMHAAIMLCFMLVGPLVMVATHIDDRRRGRRGGRRVARERATEIRRVSARLAAALDQEIDALRHLAPAPDEVLDIASGTRPGIGSRRGPTARLLRLGHGDAPSVHRLSGPTTPTLDLREAPATVTASPAALTHLDTGDDDPRHVLELVTAQLAVLHEPDDSPPLVITPEAHSHRWAWAVGSTRVDVGVAAPESLTTALDERHARTGASRALPFVVLDARSPSATGLARRLVLAGASVIWIGATPPPSVESEQVRVGATVRVRCTIGHRRSSLPDGHLFTLDSPSDTWFPTVMRLHRRWMGAGASAGARAALRTSRTDELLPADVALAWRTPTTAVPIGHDHAGVMTLDLARTGPHALVAGTTGSGKSEFLLTYLRGLFTLNSPAHVNALLIDYKGGATFGPLARAPHVVGVVTDLDHGLATRALTALRAEIARREHLLTRHGLTSYRDYLDAPPPGVVLPRFFVIVDEFRVLAEELPDFVAGLVRLAAVGRSLGMHVVLATQRPGGAVTADMRANLDVRIALRVRERSDSIDVIDAPDASRISARTPGRAFIATAGEPPLEFQSAYCGAPRALEAEVAAPHVHPTAMTSTGLVEQRERCQACRPGSTSVASDLAMFVDEAVAAAIGHAPIHRPVLAPLPEHVDALARSATTTIALDTLSTERPSPSVRQATVDISEGLDTGMPWSTTTSTDDTPSNDCHLAAVHTEAVVIGVADLPAAQSQPVVTLPRGVHVGVAGAPRSGRTTAARAFAEAARSDAALWWVGPDDPACADAHIAPDDADAVIRLLTHLAEPNEPSRTCVVIDGWEDLQATLMRINHGLAADDMLRRIGEAHRHGHTFIVTGGRQVLASKVSALLDVRLVLRQNDATEYSLAGLRPAQIPASMPAGRALVLPHGHQIHLVQSVGRPLPRAAQEPLLSGHAARIGHG